MKTAKTTLTFIALLLFSPCLLFAQGDGNPWSAQISVGYGAGMKSSVTGTSDQYNQFGQATNSENIRGSYGMGINLQIDGFYQVNECTHVGLGIGNVFGSEFTTHEYTEPTESGETVSKLSMVYINPQIRTKVAQLSDKIALEANMGLVVNMGGKVEETETQAGTNFSGPFTYEEVTETKYKSHMGCDGGLDLVYNLNDKSAIVLGIDGRILRPTEKEAEITTLQFNGMDQLSGVMVANKQWEFVDELNSGSNNPSYNSAGFDPNSPTEILRDHHDWNSYGVYARYRISF